MQKGKYSITLEWEEPSEISMQDRQRINIFIDILVISMDKKNTDKHKIWMKRMIVYKTDNEN